MKRTLRTLRCVMMVGLLSTTTFTTGCDIPAIMQIIGGVITGLSGQLQDPVLQQAAAAIGMGLGQAGVAGQTNPESVLANAAAAFANQTLAQQGVPVGVGPGGQVFGTPGINPNQQGFPGGGVPIGTPVGVPGGQNQNFISFRDAGLRRIQMRAQGQGGQVSAADIQESLRFIRATSHPVSERFPPEFDQLYINTVIQMLTTGQGVDIGGGPTTIPGPPGGGPPVFVDPGQTFPGANPNPPTGIATLPPPPTGNGGLSISVGGGGQVGGVNIGGQIGVDIPFGN